MRNDTVITTGSANHRPITVCIRLWIDVIFQGVKIPIETVKLQALSLNTSNELLTLLLSHFNRNLSALGQIKKYVCFRLHAPKN